MPAVYGRPMTLESHFKLKIISDVFFFRNASTNKYISFLCDCAKYQY